MSDESRTDREDYADHAEVIGLLRRGPSNVIDEAPPADLWARIEASLDLDDGDALTPRRPDVPSRPESLRPTGPAQADVGPWEPPSAPSAPAVEAGGDDQGHERPTDSRRAAERASVSSLGDHRRKRSERIAVLIGVAAAAVLVAVPLMLAYRASTDRPDATTELAVVGDVADASGRAELDGRTLTVDTEGLVAPDGAVHELWLLDLTDGELEDLVSLGVIGEDGTFEVDPDIDLDRFTVVDISLEPLDNDPTHSGNSLLQGELS